MQFYLMVSLLHTHNFEVIMGLYSNYPFIVFFTTRPLDRDISNTLLYVSSAEQLLAYT